MRRVNCCNLISTTGRVGRTGHLLLAVASDCTNDGVDLAADAVGGALDVLLCLSGVVLCLALGMLVLAGLGPGGGAGEVADGLDDGALQGVELASGLAVRGVSMCTTSPGSTEVRLTWAGRCWPGRTWRMLKDC